MEFTSLNQTGAIKYSLLAVFIDVLSCKERFLIIERSIVINKNVTLFMGWL